jgi:hypothetical protein
MRTSTNQETHVTILNIAKIKIKHDSVVVVTKLPNRHKLQDQAENMRNIKNMKKSFKKRVSCP